MLSGKRAKATPSAVSDEVAAILRSEVRRLRKLQRQRKGVGLKADELERLLVISEAMRELEGSRIGAVVEILGHRFRHRDVPDEILKPLLDAMTGGERT